MTVNKKLVLSASGIFICFFYHGILQEKITRSTYGKNDKFTFIFTLVFVTCVINVIFAKIMLHTFMKHGEDSTRQLYYAATGFCYLSAMVSTNMALKHVNYPTQVLGKSCKPIPVMILGVLIGKKKYPLAKYAYVFMIVFGVCLFMYKDKPAVAGNEDAAIIGMGEILLLISLTLDGFIGAIQDRMKADYQSKPAHMMYYINLWSTLVLGIVVLLTGEIWSFVPFVEKYPFIIYNLLGFSIMCALGQQIDLFGTSLQQLKIAQKKYGDSKECVEKMLEMKEGKSLLVPLTDSMYAPGQLDDTKKVLIDIGTGYYVEKELPDAIDYFKRKVKFVTTQIEKVQQIMKEKLIAREVVIETMESKIQATLAAQQAAAASVKS